MILPVQKLLALLPPTLLDRLAIQYAVNAVNQVRLTGQAVFICLLNGLVNHPKLTQRLLEETYQQLHGHSADHSSFGQRLEQINPDYFAALFRHLYREMQPRMTPGDTRSLRLRRVDATTVVLSAKLLAFGIHVNSGGRAGPGHAKRHIKTVFALGDDGLPEFLRLCREQAEANDNPALGDAMITATRPGDLWIVDAGLFDRDRLLQIHRKDGFFLVPQHGQKLRVLETLWEAAVPDGPRPHWPGPWPRTHPAAGPAAAGGAGRLREQQRRPPAVAPAEMGADAAAGAARGALGRAAPALAAVDAAHQPATFDRSGARGAVHFRRTVGGVSQPLGD